MSISVVGNIDMDLVLVQYTLFELGPELFTEITCHCRLRLFFSPAHNYAIHIQGHWPSSYRVYILCMDGDPPISSNGQSGV